MLHADHCIVYVLTNEAMPGFVKVGTTRVSVTERLKQLYTSGVPVPFECYYAGVVEHAKNVERRIHRAFDKFRVNKNREFFEIEPEAIADIIRMVALSDVTPGEDYTETPDDKAAMEKLEQRAERFSFRMVNILPGTVLHFKWDEAITCSVLDNRRVVFRGEEMSLTGATLAALAERGFHWKSAQGSVHWMHDGQTLQERREALEAED